MWNVYWMEDGERRKSDKPYSFQEADDRAAILLDAGFQAWIQLA